MSDIPISDAVAMAKTVKGFFTATKVATMAAIASAAVFHKRDDPLFRGRPNFDERSSSSLPARKSGTESSGRKSSRLAIEREGLNCEPKASRSTGSAYGSSYEG